MTTTAPFPLPVWNAQTPPVYDPTKSWEENAKHGPFFEGEYPSRSFPPQEQWTSFLGQRVASRIGIPAGPLLNARWIHFAAHMGFDILTYKTIRSHAWPSHPLPNVVPVDIAHSLTIEDIHHTYAPLSQIPPHLSALAITNSFGNPSMSPDFLCEDLIRARQGLHEGQTLIVSIFGSTESGLSLEEDFVNCARLAKEGQAPLVEANFSCPNLTSNGGELYRDPEAVYALCKRLTTTLGSTPLIIKVGAFADISLLRSVLQAAARGGAQAVCGINTVSIRLHNADGNPVLGSKRASTGLCGAPIRQIALHFLREATAINREEKLGLTLMGVGGIMAPEHFNAFFDAGADAALTATAMMWDPYLALRFHTLQQTRNA